MTTDEMLMALEYGPINYGQDDDYILVPVQTANKIAAALRAGQAMRESFNPIDDDGTSWAVNIARGNLSVAGQAWDAAMGDV